MALSASKEVYFFVPKSYDKFMLFQADEAGEDDPDEEGAPNGEEARREKYVGVKVKVSNVFHISSCCQLSI